MRDPNGVGTIVESPNADAVNGKVVWNPASSLWSGAMTTATLLLGPLFLTPASAAVFVISTGSVLLLGHSVGYHRRLIHGSFECPLWLEHFLVWCGALVGMSGPHGIVRAHDLRDWAQRQPACHPYLSNDAPMLLDYWWQLHCRLELEEPPEMDLGRVGRDRFYRFLEKTWMVHQVPIAIVLYAFGGWGFVIWGVCARIAVAVHGHWFIGHLAHTRGPQTWLVPASGVQAHDVPWAGWLTMGEAWHNNHHAYPGSARIGLYPGQSDPGYAFIRLLERLGLAWNVRTPEVMPERNASLTRPAPSSADR